MQPPPGAKGIKYNLTYVDKEIDVLDCDVGALLAEGWTLAGQLPDPQPMDNEPTPAGVDDEEVLP